VLECGLTVPIREIQKEGKITGLGRITPIQNPYDFDKVKVLGVDSKNNRHARIKKQRKHLTMTRKYNDR
jgi:hypothetical protein